MQERPRPILKSTRTTVTDQEQLDQEIVVLSLPAVGGSRGHGAPAARLHKADSRTTEFLFVASYKGLTLRNNQG